MRLVEKIQPRIGAMRIRKLGKNYIIEGYGEHFDLGEPCDWEQVAPSFGTIEEAEEYVDDMTNPKIVKEYP